MTELGVGTSWRTSLSARTLEAVAGDGLRDRDEETAMSQNGPFGIDPEDIDRALREAGESLRDALGRAGRGAGWATLIDEFTRSTRPAPEPETTGDAGDGVWAVYTTDDAGGAHIDEVYPTELDALRANKNNTDPSRRVRFLPYGIGVSALDAPE
jgi:hypothetical protein